MSFSSKHRHFMAEPIGERPASDIAGIGDVLGKRLDDMGYGKASKVLGQFLVMERNKDRFVKWLEATVEANSVQANDCYNCLSGWCEQFM